MPAPSELAALAAAAAASLCSEDTSGCGVAPGVRIVRAAALLADVCGGGGGAAADAFDGAGVFDAVLRAAQDGSDPLTQMVLLEAVPALAAAPAGRRALARSGLLGADALLECAVASAMHAGCDFLYADERRIDPADGEMKAFFKPDWSPDLQLSTNYIGCIWFAKAALYAACAPFDEAEGEYGMALRLTERAQRIVHIPLVLAERATKTLDTAAAERQALRMAAKRRGLRGTVETGCIPGVYRLRRRVPQNGAAVIGPGKGRIPGMVSIIIPTAATRGLIKICLESIRTHSSWRNFEFICLDNISDDNKEWKYFHP
jgi:hypothetical protein